MNTEKQIPDKKPNTLYVIMEFISLITIIMVLFTLITH